MDKGRDSLNTCKRKLREFCEQKLVIEVFLKKLAYIIELVNKAMKLEIQQFINFLQRIIMKNCNCWLLEFFSESINRALSISQLNIDGGGFFLKE